MAVKLCGWGPILLLACLQMLLGLGAVENHMTLSDDIAAASSPGIFSRSDPREVASQSGSFKDPLPDSVFPRINSDDDEKGVNSPIVLDSGKRFYRDNIQRVFNAHPYEIDKAIKDVFYSGRKHTISSNIRKERQMPMDGKVLYLQPESRNPYRNENQKTFPAEQNGQIGSDKESQDSSIELLHQILQSNGDNVIQHSKTTPIKNAYLTKIITYNITKLAEDNKNNSFHLETKWNYSTNFNYYDSKERLSNYSVEHSSTQQKIISGDYRKEQDSKNLIPNQDSESVGKPINSSKIDQSPNEILGIEDESFPQNNVSKLMESNQVGPTSFIGGQYVAENESGQTRFGGNNHSYDNIMGDQYLERTGGKDTISQSSNVASSEFLGGQFVPKKSHSKIIEYKNINRQRGIGNERLVEVRNIFVLGNQTDDHNTTYEGISILGNEPDKPIMESDTEIPKSHFETENNTQVLEQTGGGVEPRFSIFEEEEILPVMAVNNDVSEGSGQHFGIFKKDPDTGNYVTEIVGKYFTTDSIDDVNNKMSTGLFEEKNSNNFKDEIEGQASNFQTNNVEYNINLMHSTTIGKSLLENSLQDLEDLSLNSNTSAEHDVELYGGTTEPITGSESFHITTESPHNAGISSVELCFPISNKTRVSLLDLFSGRLFLENRGTKVPIYLYDNTMKNCTSGTEKCKLYVTFEKPQQLLNSNELIEESPNTKSRILKRGIEPVKSENIITNSTEKLELKSKNHLAGNENDGNKFRGQILSDSLTEQLLKQKLESRGNKDKNLYSGMQNSDESPLQFSLQLQPQNKILKDGYNNNVPLSAEKEKHMSGSNLNSKRITLHNIESTERSLNDISRKETPLSWQKNRHRRPVRTILTSRLENRLNSATDCGCSSILVKSAPPTPSSADFVTKRWDIVTNIVHAVKNWAIENH
ncbi:hypothetical protein J6590_055642 [Homalodisca vitripennis]|nr:hypothetical protein J6590_055642 [Homalodisca vitripennis]